MRPDRWADRSVAVTDQHLIAPRGAHRTLQRVTSTTEHSNAATRQAKSTDSDKRYVSTDFANALDALKAGQDPQTTTARFTLTDSTSRPTDQSARPA